MRRIVATIDRSDAARHAGRPDAERARALVEHRVLGLGSGRTLASPLAGSSSIENFESVASCPRPCASVRAARRVLEVDRARLAVAGIVDRGRSASSSRCRAPAGRGSTRRRPRPRRTPACGPATPARTGCRRPRRERRARQHARGEQHHHHGDHRVAVLGGEVQASGHTHAGSGTERLGSAWRAMIWSLTLTACLSFLAPVGRDREVDVDPRDARRGRLAERRGKQLRRLRVAVDGLVGVVGQEREVGARAVLREADVLEHRVDRVRRRRVVRGQRLEHGGLVDRRGDRALGGVERQRALLRRLRPVGGAEVGVERDRGVGRALRDGRVVEIEADLRTQLLRDLVHGQPAALHRVGLGHHARVEPDRALQQPHRGGEHDEADEGRDQDLHHGEALFLTQARDHEPSSGTAGVGSAQRRWTRVVEMLRIVSVVAPPADTVLDRGDRVLL